MVVFLMFLNAYKVKLTVRDSLIWGEGGGRARPAVKGTVLRFKKQVNLPHFSAFIASRREFYVHYV